MNCQSYQWPFDPEPDAEPAGPAQGPAELAGPVGTDPVELAELAEPAELAVPAELSEPAERLVEPMTQPQPKDANARGRRRWCSEMWELGCPSLTIPLVGDNSRSPWRGYGYW